MRVQGFLKRRLFFLIICGTVFCITDNLSAAVKIVAFGDSITAGEPYLEDGELAGDGRRLYPLEGYEAQLEEQMNTDGYDIEVYNYGISGEETTQGINRIESVLIAAKPDYVLLLEGTNDLSTSDPSIVINNLSGMIEAILNAGAIPVLATLTPDTRTYYGPKKNIPYANTLIEELWEEKVLEGKSVLFADLYAAVVADWDSNLSDDDHIHPNEEGYGVIAETWGKTLSEVLEVKFNWSLFIQAITSKKN